MAIKSGDTVGDYRVIGLAGSGGMGAVYEIEHVITKRVEAMKVLPLGIGSSSEDVRRFEREIEVQARLHHPNIVALYNAVRDDHSIALIMEYVEGESLEHMLDSGRLPTHTAVKYARQVLDALAYAHDQGVIHRDVKPANIIITPAGTAKLMDFGLALGVNDLRLTSAGVAVGSAWYMSPEQVKAAGQLDARTDIYAMGATLHEMLTGRKLFDADGPFAVMRAQMEAVPQAPSVFNPEVPAALDEAVARALAKDPAARFQTADEFKIVLDASLAGTCAAPSVRRDPLPPSHVMVSLSLASATLAAVVCAVVLWPRDTRVATGVRVPPDALSMPGRVMPPTIAADPARPVPAVAGQGARQTLVVKSAGRAPEPPSSTPSLRPSPFVKERASDLVAARTAPPVTVASGASAEPEAVMQSPEEAKPQRTGNRFIRALGKLNPFHRGLKNDSVGPAKAPPTDSIAK